MFGEDRIQPTHEAVRVIDVLKRLQDMTLFDGAQDNDAARCVSKLCYVGRPLCRASPLTVGGQTLEVDVVVLARMTEAEAMLKIFDRTKRYETVQRLCGPKSSPSEISTSKGHLRQEIDSVSVSEP